MIASPIRIEVAPDALAESTKEWLGQPDHRFGHLTARVDGSGRTVVDVLILDTMSGAQKVLSARLEPGQTEYPSVTRLVPAAHWAERQIGDLFGLHANGHPRWNSLILHDPAWPLDQVPMANGPFRARDPYAFLKVEGEGIHEIPVGPIHAGIIEPGHFRFSCAGEIVAYLEIRLGYLHRGVEKRLAELPWQRTRFLAESASSDTAVGNALAHAVAIEQILGVTAPPRAEALRTISLELERLANHVGDLGALCGDIGFSAGASLFAPLRGAILGLGELLAGTRFQRYYVRPGGVARDLSEVAQQLLAKQLATVKARLEELIPLVLTNSGVLDRMEGTGRLSTAQAKDFGLVGPAARASGIQYDARRSFRHGVYPAKSPELATQEAGDVLARTTVRADESMASLRLLEELVDTLPPGPVWLPCEDRSLPPDRVGVGVVEAWRGELIHWITTGPSGTIDRYAIRDPSFGNWTGLAIAVRGNLVADFPLCNKSFNLSYSGNDL